MMGALAFRDELAASHGEGCLCPDCIQDFDELLDRVAGRTPEPRIERNPS